MESLGQKDTNPPRPLRFMFKIEKPAPRPSTPSVPEIKVDEIIWNKVNLITLGYCTFFLNLQKIQNEGEVAVMHLQRLIRGRAMQVMMYESRKQRQLLINELRSTHALTKEERADKRRQMLTIRTNQTRHEYLQHQVGRLL